MKRKKTVNNKGFMLVETLIVSVFIVSVFSLLYTNFFPLIGDYERYKNYDSVESTYIAHWFRVFALNGLSDDIYNEVKVNGFKDVTDCNLYNTNVINNCNTSKQINNIKKIYLTTFSIEKFKDYVKDNDSYQRDFEEYITYLPTYKFNNDKKDNYRIIIEYSKDGINNYGNIEVIR